MQGLRWTLVQGGAPPGPAKLARLQCRRSKPSKSAVLTYCTSSNHSDGAQDELCCWIRRHGIVCCRSRRSRLPRHVGTRWDDLSLSCKTPAFSVTYYEEVETTGEHEGRSVAILPLPCEASVKGSVADDEVPQTVTGCSKVDLRCRAYGCRRQTGRGQEATEPCEEVPSLDCRASRRRVLKPPQGPHS